MISYGCFMSKAKFEQVKNKIISANEQHEYIK